jgi:thiol-disulfide isomerase/thioredoxin
MGYHPATVQHFPLLNALLVVVLWIPLPQYGGGYAPPRPAPPPSETPPPTAPPAPPPAEATPADSAPAAPAGKPTAPPAEAAPPAERVTCTAPPKAWVAKLPPEDRTALEPNLGYLLPPPTASVRMLDNSAAELPKNKIIVLQTVDAAASAPKILDKIVTAIGAMHADGDVVLVALQVPNRLDAAEKKLAKFESKATIMLDTDGVWCDTIGLYKQPVNLVIDRGGAVRYIGLTEKGVAEAAKLLAAEPARTEPTAVRPDLAADKDDTSAESAASAKEIAKFPTFTTPVTNAFDLRGKQAPKMSVDTWITELKDTKGKVIVVDFFFTGCPPCRAAIPHMNEIAAHYGEDVAVVGVSWENKSTFDTGRNRFKADFDAVKYAVGLDTSRTTIQAFGVKSYPCIAVISADNVVRWQGHPSSLDAAVMDPIVAANKAMVEASGGGKRKGSTKKTRGWSANRP